MDELPPMTTVRLRPRLELWLPPLILVLDQLTKAAVRANVPLYSTVEIVPGLLNVTHIRNSGAAFGLMNAAQFPLKTVAIAAVAVAGIVVMALYAARLAREQVAARVGLALIVGGAAGNLIDRVLEGSVVDFVDVYWRTYHFWAFNAADSAITVGVAVMLADMMMAGTRVSKTT